MAGSHSNQACRFRLPIRQLKPRSTSRHSNGNCISLYDGADVDLSSILRIALPLGTLTADKNYDVFVYNNAGTLTLELGAAWTSDIARADALVLQDGIYVKSGAPTRRYLGTFRTTSTTTTEDSVLKRFVWNYYNRIARSLYRVDGTSHVYSVPDARLWNNNSANAIAFVEGIAEAAFSAMCSGGITGLGGVIAIGLDGLAVYRNAYIFSVDTTGTSPVTGAAVALVDPQLGYHILNLLESAGAGAVTFSSAYISATVPG